MKKAICPSCEEEASFSASYSVHTHYTVPVHINHDGLEFDYDHAVEGDTEEDEVDESEVCCNQCGRLVNTDDIEIVDSEEVEA